MEELTNKQHTDYCEILNDFRCKAIDIIDELTKDYKNTLAEEIDSKLNDYHTHNEYLICELNKLEKENEKLKEQLTEQEDYKDEYYHYWQETKKELAIREKEFITYLGDIKQHLGANIVERNGYDMIMMDYQDVFHFIDSIITKIEQAKESIK